MAEAWDLVVVGGGAGGLVAAMGAAHLGAKVALVERASSLGGDCLHHGCIPSKALIAVAKRVAIARGAQALGAPAWSGRADLHAAREAVQAAIAKVAVHDEPTRFEEAGVKVLLGEGGRLLAPHLVGVGASTLRARRVLLATGARPWLPPIPGLAEAKPLTNESLFKALPSLHGRVGVLGGGPIGVELGQALHRLGLPVLLIEAAPRLLPREEPEAAHLVAQRLQLEGLALKTGCSVQQVHPKDTSGWRLSLSDGSEEAVEHLLVATGRRPNLEGLGLEALGIRHGPRGVWVGPNQATSLKHHYAVGDLCEGLAFTHVAEAQAKVALRNALVLPGGRFEPDAVPWVCFAEPELAQLGPTTEGLRALGLAFTSHRFPYAQLDRALAEGHPEGWVQLNLDPKGRLRSATVVGAAAGELIHELALARAHGLRSADLSQLIHAYPTHALALRRAADAHQALRLASWGGKVLRAWVRARAPWS